MENLIFYAVHIIWNIYNGIFDRVLNSPLQLAEVSELYLNDFA